MQQEQLTKIATLMDAIQAVTTDPKIPISKVILVQGGSANNALASALDETTTPGKKKREASPEELQKKAILHALLSDTIENYRYTKLKDENVAVVTTSHIANAIKKPKAKVIKVITELIDAQKITPIIETFTLSQGDTTLDKKVKFFNLSELDTVVKGIALTQTENQESIYNDIACAVADMRSAIISPTERDFINGTDVKPVVES